MLPILIFEISKLLKQDQAEDTGGQLLIKKSFELLNKICTGQYQDYV